MEGANRLAQPPVLSAPDLASPLRALGPGLWQVAEKPSALCHTDLHAGQFRWRGGRLTAPLDFRDIAVGPPAWDMASKACFRGWWAAGQVAGDADRDAALFGLLLAFHRAGRAARQGGPQRIEEAVAFARGCLNRLS